MSRKTKAPTIRRSEAASILALAMLSLRALGNSSDSVFSQVEQPQWLLSLRRDLWTVVENHLPLEFGVFPETHQ